MSKKYTKMFCDPDLSQRIAERIRNESKKKIKIMEVCGTHTVSIFRSGVRSLLPSTVELCSGPGCPVCVTAQEEIDVFIKLAKMNDVIIATFGDLIRVPGTNSTLQQENANGADVRIVYSTVDALSIAKQNPRKKIVFIGVGFETTAPTIAAAVFFAKQQNINNFFVFSAHKIVPPALEALASSDKVNIDGFLLPGHVSVMIGLEAYRPFFDKHQIPCVVAGFEPIDLLKSILMLVKQIEFKRPKLENAYLRVVTSTGNLKAMELMNVVFNVVDAKWRGIGIIPSSGLTFKKEYAPYDAQKIFGVKCEIVPEPKGCACGEVLIGVKTPVQCGLYKTICTPMNPVGPCMVSSEGTCAAYYRYSDNVC